MNYRKIEQASREAVRRSQLGDGCMDLDVIIAKAIAAALKEYDKQKEE